MCPQRLVTQTWIKQRVSITLFSPLTLLSGLPFLFSTNKETTLITGTVLPGVLHCQNIVNS